jgi:uncharacterized protein YggL (DUF469 family)
MSIFKESFREYVRKQFRVRQAVISRGNSDRIGLGSTSRIAELPADTKGDIPRIQAGAFYSYGQKQCVIRLSSLVDLMEDIGLDLGGDRFESYRGETFARNFILEGGVLSDYERRDAEGNRVVRKVAETRGGFPQSSKRVNLSYGDPSIASNPDSDGYGAVPMPGIVDANVRTKSAYGSLREAKVNFVCHNLRQLEILELLYMRPGYPVLMEWGWTPHIKNDGSIENIFNSISDNDSFWDDSQVNQKQLQDDILERKKSSNGNYDGFVGFVTNFSYTARADGGFNCTTELISMGEVIDSLKVPSVGFSSIDTSDFSELDEVEKKKIIYRSSLGVLMSEINYAVGTDVSISTDLREEALNEGLDPAEINQGDLNTKAGELIGFARKNLREILGDDFIDQALIERFTVLKDKDGTEIQTKTGFIRWDALADLINKLVIPSNEKNQKPTRIETNLYRTNSNGAPALDPILYAKYTDSNDAIMDVSCSPNVCILPHQFNDFQNDELKLKTSRIAHFGFGYAFGGWEWIKKAFTAESQINETELPNLNITSEIADRRIGNIFIGVNFLVETFEKIFKNNKDATLGEFLKAIWDGINNQCPMHNFGLRVDTEYTDIIQVIDLPITTDDIREIDFDTLFKFNVHSNDTIVREFKYDTQIPNALKATIAINAQAGATADDIDSVTFAAFNRSIKSRLHSLSEKFSEKEASSYASIQNTRQEKKDRLAELQQEIFEYNNLFFNLIDAQEDDDYESRFANIKTIIKEAQSLENYLESSTSGYLKNQSIIPINLNLVIDGISGIIIGNVFRVDESRLPRAYRQRRVGFVVLGEEQNITAGQDWTTNIRGQIVLFPSGTNKHKFRETQGTSDNKTLVELNNIEQNTELAEDVNEVETFEASQQELQDQLFPEYLDLNRRFFAKAWTRDFLVSETFGSGTNVFAGQINQLNVELTTLVDEWEELRPQFEEAFGADFFGVNRSTGEVTNTTFRTRWITEEGNKAIPININGQNYTVPLEQPRLSPDTVNVYLNNVFTAAEITVQ